MILCAGEALVDMVPQGGAYLPCAGGAALNAARALGRLGVPVALIGGLGRDHFGQMIHTALEESQVETGYLARSDRPSALAFVTLTQGEAQYLFYDANSADRMVTRADLPAPAARAALFGGISLARAPCAEAFESYQAHLHARGTAVMIDPNIRPAMVEDASAYRARLGRMLTLAQIVKVSDEDLAWLAPGQGAEGFAQDMLAQGARLVCHTRGAAGVRAYSAEGVIALPAPQVKVVDTVGAGDTFNAGLLAGLHDQGALGAAQWPLPVLRRALDLALRAAAASVTLAGAQPPWRSAL